MIKNHLILVATALFLQGGASAKTTNSTSTSESGAASLSSEASVANILNTIDILNSPTNQKCDETNSELFGVKCSDLSENFCKNLWSESHKGSVKTPTGEINVGNYPNTDLSYATILGIKNLIEVKNQLPEDLKNEISTGLNKLDQLIKNPKKTRDWEITYNSYVSDLDNKVEQITFERLKKTNPEIANKPTSEWSHEDNKKYSDIKYKLFNEVVDARYNNSPKWKRVETQFALAKADIIKTISTMNISDSLKSKMKSKVSTIVLSKPYAKTNCRPNTDNAFYSTTEHYFTICPGMFNTAADDTAIYSVIAHEIAHSIDPNSIGQDEYMNNEMIKKLNATKSSIAPIKCEEWNNLITKMKSLYPNSEIKKSELYNLNKCLDSAEKDLEVLNTDNLSLYSRQYGERIIDQQVSDNTLTLLTSKKSLKNGKTIENEYYLRPDLIFERDLNFQNKNFEHTQPPHVFIQSYKCQDKKLSEKEKFKNSIEETKTVFSKMKVIGYNECNEACSTYKENYYEVSENFADWMASQAFQYRLKEQTESEKLWSGGLFGAIFCEQPNFTSLNIEKTEIEKEYSTEEHGLDHLRRLSIFNENNAKLIKCDLDEKLKKGYSLCKP